jgi:hypothetical protein
MTFVHDMLRALAHELEAVLRSVPELSGLILRIFRLYCGRRKGGEGTPIDCLPVPPHIYLRPDASLYSQSYLMSLGLAVTWDNPDIELVDASNTVVPSHDLKPATTYTVRATIHNRSNTAPAIATPVHFTLFSFGVGGTGVQAIGSDIIDLPVRAAPGEPAVAQVTWTTPSVPGHYCIQVDVICADDANPLDNTGQENTVVGGPPTGGAPASADPCAQSPARRSDISGAHALVRTAGSADFANGDGGCNRGWRSECAAPREPERACRPIAPHRRRQCG